MARAASQPVAVKDLPTRKALGRGLAALMPGAPAAPSGTGAAAASSTGYRVLPIERIRPNKGQPRKVFKREALAELATSIGQQGVLQPIIVRRRGDGYEIVAGERRWRAAQQAGLREIPAVIKELTDLAVLEVALIENVQRQDLDPLEEAEAYGRLIRDHGLTHEQVADAVAKSRSAISNSLRLLKLPREVQAMLADGRLTAGHARALMALDNDRDIVRLAEDFVGRHATVRDAELRVKEMLAPAPRRADTAPSGGAPTPAQIALQERLQRALGTKVRLHERDGDGRIEIYFHSLDALDGLLDKLCPA